MSPSDLVSPLTSQALYDRVARHLLTQAARARSPVGVRCRYRTASGLRCAIGALIPAAEYSPSYERLTVDHPIIRDAAGVSAATAPLAGELQALHDSAPLASWPSELARVAREHGLSRAVLEEPCSLRLSPRLAARLASPEVRYGTRVDLYPTRAALMADPSVVPIHADADGPLVDGRPAYYAEDIVAYDRTRPDRLATAEAPQFGGAA